MKFKTKLAITFLTMFLLPLALSCVAFFAIGTLLLRSMNLYPGMESSGFSMFSNTVESYSQATNEHFNEILETSKFRPHDFEDRVYLEILNKKAQEHSSYIIIRRADTIFYAGDQDAAEKIFRVLPAFGRENERADAGFYFNDLKKLVKQVDFLFSDQVPGSAFIVTRVGSVFSQSFLIDMMLAIVIILLITSVVLTQWIHKSIFHRSIS